CDRRVRRRKRRESGGLCALGAPRTLGDGVQFAHHWEWSGHRTTDLPEVIPRMGTTSTLDRTPPRKTLPAGTTRMPPVAAGVTSGRNERPPYTPDMIGGMNAP